MMNLASLDLNLLVALDALLSESHVGKAAARIGLSQPAASHALQRLREITGDPLLVRAGAKMQLTARAEALRDPLAEALDQVRGLFVDDPFDPATSTRRFAVMMPDHVVDLMVPSLLARISAEAPSIRLDVTPWRGSTLMTPELARSIDLVIACVEGGQPGFHRERLFADTEAVAVRRGHPLGRRLSRMSTFLKARHVAVIASGQREDPMDTWLRGKGIERGIGLVVPNYLQALHVVARTDLVAFVPCRLIEALADPLSLEVVKPPIDPGLYEEFMFYPARAATDAASIWLRSHVVRVGRALNRLEGR
jgi:DNA-binding transcriptional LysR family regulator